VAVLEVAMIEVLGGIEVALVAVAIAVEEIMFEEEGAISHQIHRHD
jgi:hypothetical protein